MEPSWWLSWATGIDNIYHMTRCSGSSWSRDVMRQLMLIDVFQNRYYNYNHSQRRVHITDFCAQIHDPIDKAADYNLLDCTKGSRKGVDPVGQSKTQRGMNTRRIGTVTSPPATAVGVKCLSCKFWVLKCIQYVPHICWWRAFSRHLEWWALLLFSKFCQGTDSGSKEKPPSDISDLNITKRNLNLQHTLGKQVELSSQHALNRCPPTIWS